VIQAFMILSGTVFVSCELWAALLVGY